MKGCNYQEERNYQMGRKMNRLTVLTISAIDTFLILGYLASYLQGEISLGYMLLVEVLTIGTLTLNDVIFFKKKDSKKLKYISLIGYIFVYAVICLNSVNDMAFTVLFPMLVMYILYFDFKLVFYASLAFGTINIADVIYCVAILKHHHSGAAINSSTILLQAASVIVFLVSMCLVTKLSNEHNGQQIDDITKEKEQNEQLLSDVIGVVKAVKINTNQAGDFISELVKNINVTASSLQDISAGNDSNANSIEEQRNMTESIQSMIKNTGELANQMKNLSAQSKDKVISGLDSVQRLNAQSQDVDAANKKIIQSVENLVDNAAKVNSITNQIFEISKQTNLLALNAAIESSRAGEAGKGFAVVANEVRQLADETRNLTENIQKIVGELQQNGKEAQNTVDVVVNSTKTEHELISMVNSQFTAIEHSMKGLDENVVEITKKIEEILHSNNSIVESITDISSVSEEVAASAQESTSIGEETKQKAERAIELMDELKDTVRAVDKYIK